MFFMYGNSIQDSVKLLRRRVLVKNFIEGSLLNSKPVVLSKLHDGLFFIEDSLQVVELRTVNVEDYVLENFSF